MCCVQITAHIVTYIDNVVVAARGIISLDYAVQWLVKEAGPGISGKLKQNKTYDMLIKQDKIKLN